MSNRREENQSRLCPMSHHVLNQLSVIVGNCDIMRDRAEHSQSADPICLKRLAAIRDIAMELASEVRHRGCELDEVADDMLRKSVAGAAHERTNMGKKPA
jgi:hypothetical protein